MVCSNIMWLDGMYMLPLIMLGIYLYVNNGKVALFYIANACSIVFCWYTGYMNCIFAVLYYICERTQFENEFRFGQQLKKFFKFILLELLSVLLSCAAFLPVLLGQSSGRTFDDGVLNFATNGSLLGIMKGFLIGSYFPSRQITLFCTVAVLIFFFSFWFSKPSSLKQKAVAGGLLGVMVASLLFKPLENMWCGFKFASSYMYRFAYLAVMVVIYIAAMQIRNLYSNGKLNLSDKSILRGSGIFILILLLADWVEGVDQKKLWIQISLILIYTAVIYFISNKDKMRKFLRCAVNVCVVLVFVLEVMFNAKIVVTERYSNSADRNSEYTSAQEELINNIKSSDQSFFRIEQTSNRSGVSTSKFYANESLAYGYSSLQTYTSCYDSTAAQIIVDSGYCTREFPSFYNNPLLATDSFLGIKYLLTDKEYAGYQLSDISGTNEKDVYYNKYALSLGFKAYDGITDELEYSNSFEYVNALYSAVLGEKTEIYKKIGSYSVNETEDELIYSFNHNDISDGDILYVSFENSKISCQSLCVNSQVVSAYDKATWGTWDSCRYLGEMGEIKEVSLIDCNISADEMNENFYYLDMDVFENAISYLKDNSAEIGEIYDGYVNAEYTAEQDGYVLFTIPYESGWSVEVNGEKVETVAGAGQYLSVPVTKGTNSIVMNYSMRGKYAGVGLSVISVTIFAAVCLIKKRKNRSVKK